MQPDTLPLPLPAPSPATIPLGERLAWSIPDLSTLTTISVRQLRRLDCDRCIPGRLTCGRRVLFCAETIREWIREGMPICARSGNGTKTRTFGG